MGERAATGNELTFVLTKGIPIPSSRETGENFSSDFFF